MTSVSATVSWTPRGTVDGAMETVEFATAPVSNPPGKDAQKVQARRPTQTEWPRTAQALRRAAGTLRAMPAQEIIDAIDHAASLWCDRTWRRRIDVRNAIADFTQMSRASVDHSFDLELRNYRAPALRRALLRDFGNLECLDRFACDDNLNGATRAIGPALIAHVLTGNVPGLPALEIVRSLLVKSAFIAKVASGEPFFARSFIETLSEIDDRLGDAALVTYWDREETDILEAVIDQVDVVVAYGGASACAAVRRATPAFRRYIEHGHKVSVGVVSKAYRAEQKAADLAAAIAADACAFNQNACIAPQIYFIEGDPIDVRSFAVHVRSALVAYSNTRPSGNLSDDEAAAVQLWRAGQSWRIARLGASTIWTDDALNWTLIVDSSEPLVASGGNRRLQLAPAPGLDVVLERICQLAPHLQNVALGVTRIEFDACTNFLAEAGASRICAPGRMAEPSMAWRHDGRLCLAGLVSWCDIEMHPHSITGQSLAAETAA